MFVDPSDRQMVHHDWELPHPQMPFFGPLGSPALLRNTVDWMRPAIGSEIAATKRLHQDLPMQDQEKDPAASHLSGYWPNQLLPAGLGPQYWTRHLNLARIPPAARCCR
jgi:hypothetical protein